MDPSVKVDVAFCNHFFPSDAKLLRGMYRQCADLSQRHGWKHVHESVIGARVLAIATIPVAAIDTLTYAARGILRGGVELLNGDVCKALSVTCNDTFAALQCLALVIASIAYATLGLFLGSTLFKQWIPEAATPILEERLSDLKSQLTQLTKENDSLKISIESLRQSKVSLVLEKKEALEKVIEAKKALDANEETISELEKKRSKLIDVLTENQEQFDRKEAIISQIRQRHLILCANYSKLKKSYEDLEHATASKEVQLEMQLALKLAALEEKSHMIASLLERTNNLEAPPPPQTLLPPDEKLEAPSELEKSFILMDSTSDITQQSSSWFDSVASFGAQCLNLATFVPTLTAREIIKAIQKAIKKTSTAFIDKRDPWKAQRYIKSSSTLANAFGKKAIDALKKLENSTNNNPVAEQIVKHIRTAMDALTIPGINAKAGKQFDEFQKALCEALTLLKKVDHGLDSKLISELNRLCHDFFTKIDFLTFYTKLVYYVATSRRVGLSEKLGLDGINTTSMPLSEKMELIYEALPKNGSDFTAPTAHVLAAKMGVLFSAFDPLHDSNIPTTLLRKVHTSADTSKPPIESIHFRTGVPIGPKLPNTEKKPWEIADVAFVPEYEALLDHLKTQKEKLLVILHLDPLYYDEVANGGNSPKAKEAVWVRMFMALAESEKYRDTLEIALLPLDGSWLTVELENGLDQKGKSIQKMDDFIDWLTDVATRAKSPFILPASVGDKQAFVRNVAAATRARYFPQAENNEILLDTKERRQAFLGFFQGLLAEALQIQTGAKRVQRNCKDAVDRTMSVVGTEMLHSGTVLNQTEDPGFQHNLIGSIFGASLANVKRRILHHHRFEIFMNALKYLEWMKREGISLGPVPQFNGYALTSMEFPEDPEMSLYAEPSQVATEAEYVSLLNFEQAHPYTLPTQIQLSQVKIESAFEEVFASLKGRYSSTELKYQLKEDDKIDSSEKERIKVLKRKYFIQQEAKNTRGEILVSLRFNLDKLNLPPQYSYEVIVH